MIITLTKKVERIQRLRALFKELEECIEGSPLPPTEISGVYRDTVIFEGKLLIAGLIIGLFIGGFVGVSVMCLLYYTRD